MYSAAPSALTETVLIPPAGHRATGLERGLDAMSLSSHAHRNGSGHGYGDEYGQGLDEFGEEEPPLGYGIEHACRCVIIPPSSSCRSCSVFLILTFLHSFCGIHNPQCVVKVCH